VCLAGTRGTNVLRCYSVYIGARQPARSAKPLKRDASSACLMSAAPVQSFESIDGETKHARTAASGYIYVYLPMNVGLV
jgi:hypothetical protein